MNNHGLALISLVFFFLSNIIPTNAQEATISVLVKLRKRMIELKQISADKQQQIDNLENTVLSLSSQSNRLRRENEELRTTIRTKTEQIFELRGDLADVMAEYDRILLNLEQINFENIELKEIIRQIELDKQNLRMELNQANDQIQFMTDSLERAKFSNEALIAEVDNLESKLNEILNEIVFVNFIELSLNLFRGARFSYQSGILLKRSNLFLGLKVGYQFIKIRNDSSPTIDLGFLPISVQLASVIKNKIGFEYVGINEKIIDNYKVFLFADVGWSIGLHSAEDSVYNTGGLNASFGPGMILNLNEGVNAYGKATFNIQNIGGKDISSTRTFFHPGLVFGLMF